MHFVKGDDPMKKKWFACGLICMLILASIAHAESISASLSGQIWNLDLTRSPMAYTDEGTIVLAGRDGNASPTDDTIEARLYCIDGQGNLLWQYISGAPGTKNYFYNVSQLPNGDIQVCQRITQGVMERDCLLRVRQGELISQMELPEDVMTMYSLGNDLLLVTPREDWLENGAMQYIFELSLLSPEGELLWSCCLEEPCTVSGVAALPEGYAIFGSQFDAQGAFHPYLAVLNAVGQTQWSLTMPQQSARYQDAAVSDEGNIVVVGGTYENADGTGFPTALIACYTPEGKLLWQREEDYHELGFLYETIAKVPEGYVATGANSSAGASTHIVFYDHDGGIIFQWDEPLPTEYQRLNRLWLQTIGKDVYLVACGIYGDTGWPLQGAREFRTNIKNIYYYSPL